MTPSYRLEAGFDRAEAAGTTQQATGISPTWIRGSDTLSEKPELFALSQIRGKREFYLMQGDFSDDRG